MHVKKLVAALVVMCLAAAPAHAYQVDPSYSSDRTALAVVRPDGSWSGSDNALEERPALSLSKLYLGYWALYNGTEEDKELVQDMIAVSHDGYAQRLDRKYPEAIDEIAEDFDLTETARYGSWGRTVTSAYDVAKFVTDILWDPRAKPLLDGMIDKPETARDGFEQLFGVADLDNVGGIKSGWSDDRVSQTGSVGFGETDGDVWVVAALTWGDASDNTEDVRAGIIEREEPEPESQFQLTRESWTPGEPAPVEITKLDLT